MLTDDEKDQLIKIVNLSLDNAEQHWKNGGYKLIEELIQFREAALIKAESEPSNIPGHEIVQDQTTVIDEFIALVADMRESSKHLMCAISSKTAKISGLQRVYFETSALLPAIAKTIKFKSGSVTEYLGDGVLALYRVDSDNKSEAIYNAHDSAKNIIGDTRKIVNDIINSRYSLPQIDLGVGLALSKTLVTLVGLSGEKHPKAFGECVFRATKLSSGVNMIYSDEQLRKTWPKSKGGKINFREKSFGSFKGYLLNIKK